MTVATGTAHFTYVLRLGDDNLIMAQRLAEWSSRAHDLESDIALTNMALDHLGQARALLTHAGHTEDRGRTEDDLAFHRSERQYTNLLLAEQPNGDFAQTIVRQLLFSAHQLAVWDGLTTSADPTLAGIAAKALKEARYHYEHAGTWTLRLGAGTAESHARMSDALERLWCFTEELFLADDIEDQMLDEDIGLDLASLSGPWRARIDTVLAQASLSIPEDQYQRTGGRHGMHGTDFGYLLAEMQHLPRSLPGATW